MLLMELLIEQIQKNEKLQQRLLTLQTLSLNVLPLEVFIDPSLKSKVSHYTQGVPGCSIFKVPLLYKKGKSDQD